MSPWQIGASRLSDRDVDKEPMPFGSRYVTIVYKSVVFHQERLITQASTKVQDLFRCEGIECLGGVKKKSRGEGLERVLQAGRDDRGETKK